ncbi:DUF4337 domain-containing protein [Siculibacillus lacustris]|uniref:DUF4337 domain-containing protein n=1 Tax=Siculibacillus lacustris TaxID=1549641 RepID=A0A4Q9VTE2_9HYPH|nr:DUF4337 domain-containing protein [Siculibacillus lacustris]TBW39210.1 DUF4337 domain-containing protein [Siculibacillus lacustris]
MADIEIPTGESQSSRDSFNNSIAIAVALVSAFMAVSKIKDDNIVQAMQKAQAESVDYWNEYQARRQRQFGVELAIEQTRATQAVTPELEAKLADWKKQADVYKARAEESATKAKAREADYNAGNDRDDLFDLSDALLSIGLAMFAVTALTRVRWLFGVASVAALSGAVFGVAGFNGWTALHPDFLISFLN